MTSETGWRWSLAGLAFAGLCGATLPVLLAWPQLPEPLAVHWSLDLTPDGSLPRRVLVAVNVSLVALALVVAWLGGARSYARGRAARLMLLTFASAMATTVTVTIVTRNLGKPAWTDAESLTGWLLAALIALPLAAGALTYFVGLRAFADRRPPGAAARTALPLASGARAFWSGTASNVWLAVIGVAVLVQALLTAGILRGFVPPPPPFRLGIAAILIVAAVMIVSFARIRVAIDDRGLAIHYGHLALWRRFVPLPAITGAHDLKLDALEHGGWGYRGGLRLFGKAAIVVRSGEAVRLDLVDGKRLFVTVDDAATAAQLLNGLIERERSK